MAVDGLHRRTVGLARRGLSVWSGWALPGPAGLDAAIRPSFCSVTGRPLDSETCVISNVYRATRCSRASLVCCLRCAAGACDEIDDSSESLPVRASRQTYPVSLLVQSPLAH
jgi:hypothetical protein